MNPQALQGQTEDWAAFPIVLKGPGLKEVRLELVFEDEGLGSFFHCEGSLSENITKEKKARPALTKTKESVWHYPLSLSRQGLPL